MTDEGKSDKDATPSPSTLGKGRGEGQNPKDEGGGMKDEASSDVHRSSFIHHPSGTGPLRNPLPAYGERGPERWRVLAALLFVLVVALAFRIPRISEGSLTFDEQWHLELSTGRGSPHVRVPENQFIPKAPAVTSLTDAPPWYAVWPHMDFVVHPPLYVTLLRFWRTLFGDGDLAARSYSNLCQLIAIAFMFLAACRFDGLAIAIWAGLIYSVAPTQIYLAQQVRGYDQLAAFGMLAVYCLVRIERDEKSSRKHTVFLGLAVLGTMLSHYFAVGACLAMAVYVLLRFRGKKLISTSIAFVSAAVAYLIVWGPFLYQQRRYFAETADIWLIENTPEHLAHTLGRLASWCWWLVLRDYNGTPYALASVIVLIAPIVLIFLKRKDLMLWYLWLLGTLGFVACLDLFRSTSHLRFERYVSLASPAVFMLIAGIAAALPRKLMHLPLAIIVAVAAMNWNASLVGEMEPDWRPYGQLIDQRVADDEPLIFFYSTDPMTRWHIEIFYLGAAHYSHKFPHPIVKLSVQPMPESLLKELPTKTAWLVTGPIGKDISSIIPGARMIGDEQFVIPNLLVCTHIELPER